MAAVVGTDRDDVMPRRVLCPLSATVESPYWSGNVIPCLVGRGLRIRVKSVHSS